MTGTFKSRVDGAMSIPELRAAKRKIKEYTGPAYDVSGDDMLLQTGEPPNDAQWETITEGISAFHRQGNKFEGLELDAAIAVERAETEDANEEELLEKVLSDWLSNPETRKDTWIHRSALIRGTEQINGAENSRERSRVSFFIKVRWNVAQPMESSRPAKRQKTNKNGNGSSSIRDSQEIEEAKKSYVAAVQYFVRIPFKDKEGVYARFAICDYYHYQEPLQDADTGEVLRVKHYKDHRNSFVDESYVTPLEIIDTKLVGLWRSDPTDENVRLQFFTTNPGQSGHII